MQTIQKNETALKAEHWRCVRDISGALSQLQDALTAEKDFRRKVQLEAPEFHADLPALKFPIQLCKKESCKEYSYISDWRRDATDRGLLEGE